MCFVSRISAAAEVEEEDEDSDSETPQITIVYKTKREQIDAFKVRKLMSVLVLLQCM